MSHEKNPGWLGYIGDYNTQICFIFHMGDSNTNQSWFSNMFPSFFGEHRMTCEVDSFAIQFLQVASSHYRMNIEMIQDVLHSTDSYHGPCIYCTLW